MRIAMLTHSCLDPHDPFAEREVLVEFTHDTAGLRLLAARDAEGYDILPDLLDVQRDDLRRELAARGRNAGPAGLRPRVAA